MDNPAETMEEPQGNKRVALLIAALALALALTEVAGDDAKSEAQMRNVEGANLWAFFQAKTVRQTTLRGLSDLLPLLTPAPGREAEAEAMLGRWRASIERWESEPETQEGRRELMARAKATEQARDEAMRRDGHYDLAAAMLQLAIVLGSAAIITGAGLLVWLGGGLGLAGAGLSLLTFLGLT
ncbi:DUF4337 domain-containing protein [Roseomonas sp. GC11]|uniref:DUF4337 domain-containing protein n=1 Tax=Roseomonas sp. GC11 TaxID=2950546 RepID=UPI00210E2418|nr:DUF4337 domain-containing protein [Roseomonas sp. GC11]MCQ4162490.1 DUF4337 domain-containing protein [Roseomonas sp. GC11]